MEEVAEFEWVPLKPMVAKQCTLPKLLWSHGTTVVGHRVYVTFGETVKGHTNRVFVFDYHNQHWSSARDPPQQLARSCHTSFVLDEKLWLYGGSNGMRDLGDLWFFDLLLEEWVEFKTVGSHPGGRYAFSAGYIERTNELIVFGGAKQGTLTNDVYSLDFHRHTWVKPKVVGKAPRPRACSASCVGPSKLFVFGGGGRRHVEDAEEMKAFQFNDLHVLSTDYGQYVWSRLDIHSDTSPPSGRLFTSLTRFRDKLFVFGGLTTRRHNDLHVYHIAKKSWHRLARSLGDQTLDTTAKILFGLSGKAKKNFQHSAVELFEKVLVFGGKGLSLEMPLALVPNTKKKHARHDDRE